jgi:hypothetical protein
MYTVKEAVAAKLSRDIYSSEGAFSRAVTGQYPPY